MAGSQDAELDAMSAWDGIVLWQMALKDVRNWQPTIVGLSHEEPQNADRKESCRDDG